jgi:hypothetical protein
MYQLPARTGPRSARGWLSSARNQSSASGGAEPTAGRPRFLSDGGGQQHGPACCSEPVRPNKCRQILHAILVATRISEVSTACQRRERLRGSRLATLPGPGQVDSAGGAAPHPATRRVDVRAHACVCCPVARLPSSLPPFLPPPPPLSLPPSLPPSHPPPPHRPPGPPSLPYLSLPGLAGAPGRPGRGAPKTSAPGRGAGRCKQMRGATWKHDDEYTVRLDGSNRVSMAGPRPGHLGNRNINCCGRVRAAAIIS